MNSNTQQKIQCISIIRITKDIIALQYADYCQVSW